VLQVADDDRDVPEALLLQRRRELDQRALAGVREGLPQHQVLGRIPGEGRLGEDDEVGARLGRLRRPLGHQLRVPGEVTDAGVDLSQTYPQLHRLLIVHRSSLVAVRGERPGGGDGLRRPVRLR
jgi:hypothetical protein